MGLGGTAKKIKKLSDLAEKMYAQVGELRETVTELRDRVEMTTERIEHLEAESRRQRALIEAMADQQGVDVDAVLDEVESELAAEESEEADDEAEPSDETADAEPAEPSAGHDKD